MASVNGIDLAYRVEGRGPPLVLIHGLACGGRMWVRQRRLGDGFTLISYDQRGHGRSGAPDEARAYSPGHLARDLIGLLDHLRIARCALVGFSLGGGPALALAARSPRRVSGLVLADVGAGSENPALMGALARRWGALARREGVPALAEDMLTSELFRSYAGQGARARRHMRALIRATPLPGLVHTLAEVVAKRTPLFRMTRVLRSLAVPTLVLVGEQDYLCRRSAGLLAGTIPGARELRIPGAGHMAPLEAPEAFNDAVRRFCGPLA